MTAKTSKLHFIRRMTLKIGGISVFRLQRKMQSKKFGVTIFADQIIYGPYFNTLRKKTKIEIGFITVRDLGFRKNPTFEELFAKVRQINGVCRAEVGPHLRLVYNNQRRNTRCWIAMETIPVCVASPAVFLLADENGEKRMHGSMVLPYRWGLNREIVVRCN